MYFETDNICVPTSCQCDLTTADIPNIPSGVYRVDNEGIGALMVWDSDEVASVVLFVYHDGSIETDIDTVRKMAAPICRVHGNANIDTMSFKGAK